MALKKHNPKTTHKPLSPYSHGIVARESARWLHVSGQVGIDPKGKITRGFKTQCARAWRNVIAVLKEADMGVDDLVKVNVFLTRAQDIADYRAIRQKFQGRARPASTLLIISALAHPDLLVEIEAIAAKE